MQKKQFYDLNRLLYDTDLCNKFVFIFSVSKCDLGALDDQTTLYFMSCCDTFLTSL